MIISLHQFSHQACGFFTLLAAAIDDIGPGLKSEDGLKSRELLRVQVSHTLCSRESCCTWPPLENNLTAQPS